MDIKFDTTFDDDGKDCRIVGYKEPARSARHVELNYIHRLWFLRCGKRGYKLEKWRSSPCLTTCNQLAYLIDVAEDPKYFYVKVFFEENSQEQAISIAQKALDHYLSKIDEPANGETQQSVSKTKQASKLLLSMESEHLEVWSIGADVCVCYANCDIKDGGFLRGEFGIGTNFEEACEDYLAKIRGKTLVFRACSSQRKEVEILE